VQPVKFPVKAVTNQADGSTSAVLHGDLVKVSETNVREALATLLDEIAWLEGRVEVLERARKENSGTERT
jgi:hypothetical protein